MPSKGIYDPIWAKALALRDDRNTSVMFVTLDAVGMDATLSRMALDIAGGLGVPLNASQVMFSASHTHSGPGAISTDFLFQVSPSTDVLVPELQRAVAEKIAQCMAQAWHGMRPAVVGIGSGLVDYLTFNRRADFSPHVKRTSIDPHMNVIRVDDAVDGTPIATLWNFAIHGSGAQLTYARRDISLRH